MLLLLESIRKLDSQVGRQLGKSTLKLKLFKSTLSWGGYSQVQCLGETAIDQTEIWDIYKDQTNMPHQ